MASILFQPTNGLGLGHVSRLAAIALALRHDAPHIRTVFGLAGGGQSILETEGLPYVSLPSDLVHDEPVWHAWEEGRRKQLKFGMIETVFRVLDPTLVVFDVLPSLPYASIAL